MPTYDYECDACEHTFELFQGINDSLKKKCPECGRLKLRRLFGTGAAIVFKGSGFYQTDYRSADYKKAAEKDRKAGEKSKESKSESKSSDSTKSSGSSDSTKSSGSSDSTSSGGDSKKSS
jgi:putative FmdB family regulatory protein